MTRTNTRITIPSALLAAALLCAIPAGRTVAQSTFLRGDVNNDGRVSIADLLAMNLYHHRDYVPACLDTVDVDDDGRLWLWDRDTLEHLLFGWNSVETISAPFPARGGDLTEDELPCDQYDGEAGLVTDSDARIEIADAVMPGGDNALVVLKVRLAHSRAIGGYSGVFSNPNGVFRRAGLPRDVDGHNNSSQAAGGPHSTRNCRLEDGAVVFHQIEDSFVGNEAGDPERGFLPPASDYVALKLYFLLEPGTKAGTYPLTFEAAEMADFETGFAIVPQMVSGTLTVEADVEPDAATPSTNNCEFLDPVPAEGPEDVQARFAIGLADALRGSTATIPISMVANVPIEGFALSIDYRIAELQCVDVRPILFAGGEDWEFFDYSIDETDGWAPHSGAAAVRAIFGEDDPVAYIPAEIDQVAVELDFEVREAAEPGFSEVRFRSGATLGGQPVSTSVRAYGRDLTAGSMTCFKPYGGSSFGERWYLTDGGVSIDRPDNVDFLRGDVNIDGAVSISDVAMLRRALFFIGADPLPCDDAGDADDTGSVNITDAITILNHLFGGTSSTGPIAAPFPEPGADPTNDPLTCPDYDTQPAEVGGDRVTLATVEAGPGEEVLVPILISSAVDTEAFQLLVGYDPELFTPARGGLIHDGSVFDEAGVSPGGFAHVEPDPELGVFSVGFLASFGPTLEIPAGEDVVAGMIRGTIAETAPVGTELTLRLTEGNDPLDSKIRNELTHVGSASRHRSAGRRGRCPATRRRPYLLPRRLQLRRQGQRGRRGLHPQLSLRRQQVSGLSRRCRRRRQRADRSDRRHRDLELPVRSGELEDRSALSRERTRSDAGQRRARPVRGLRHWRVGEPNGSVRSCQEITESKGGRICVRFGRDDRANPEP